MLCDFRGTVEGTVHQVGNRAGLLRSLLTFKLSAHR